MWKFVSCSVMQGYFHCSELSVCLSQDFQRQLSQLIPEQQKLKERLRTVGLNDSTCTSALLCPGGLSAAGVLLNSD